MTAQFRPILKNLRRPAHLLRVFLMLGLLIPFLQPFVAESAPLPEEEIGQSYEAATDLLRSADPLNHLPTDALVPFADNSAQSPFAFLDGVVSSPMNRLPFMSDTEEPAASTGSGLGVLDQVNSIRQELDSAPGEKPTVGQRVMAFLTGFNREWGANVTEPATDTPTETQETGIDTPNGLYLPLVAQTGTEPVTQPENYTYESPDGVLTLSVPSINFDEAPVIDYAPVSRSNLVGVDPTDRVVQESLWMGVISAETTRSETVRFIKQRAATIQITYDDASVFDERALSLFAYSEDSDSWFSLPSSVDTENNVLTAQTGIFSLYSIAGMVIGAEQDPCAIPTKLSDEYPWRDEGMDSDDRDPRVIYEGDETYRHYYGTQLYLSGGNTIDDETSDPTQLENSLTHSHALLTGPEGNWSKAYDEWDYFDEPIVDSERDLTGLMPPEPDPVPPPAEPPRYEDFTINSRLTYEDLSMRYSGSTEQWVVRRDIAPPYRVNVYTYHDGYGGVNIYVRARDNCAVARVTLTSYSNTVWGGGSGIVFEHFGTFPDGSHLPINDPDDGWGWYRASVQMANTGTNSYTFRIDDMNEEYSADPEGAESNWSQYTYTEMASSSSGYGDLRFKGFSCSVECGSAEPAVVASTGDPINTASGNFTMTEVDAIVVGTGDTDTVISRSYNSNAAERYDALFGEPREPVGMMGVAWTSPFDFEIEIRDYLPLVGPGVKVIYPDGRTSRYAGTSGMLEPLTLGESDILEVVGGSYILTDADTLVQHHFDDIGRLTQIVDANDNVTVYGDYIDAGPQTITNASGRTLSLAYDADGLLTQITGPENLSISYTYDGLFLKTVNDNRGKLTTYNYACAVDGQGRNICRLSEIVTPKTHKSMQLFYYPDGRVRKQIMGATESYEISYDDTLDGDGFYTRTIEDAEGNVSIQKYDDLFRIRQVEDAEGFIEQYAYYDENNLRQYLIDKNGNRWDYVYDERSNLLQTTSPPDREGSRGITRYEDYNQFDRPERVIDAEGRETRFEYDAAGNLEKIINADGVPMMIEYYADGQPKKITDYNENVIMMTYSDMGDLETLTNGANETVTFVYDQLGRMTDMTTHEGHPYRFEYDVASDLLTKIEGPLGYEVEYFYDDNGNLDYEIDARDNQTDYEYDSSENLIHVKDALDGYTYYRYDLMNNLEEMEDELGRVTIYGYDSVYNLTSIAAPEDRTTEFTYDGNRNITTITDGEDRVTELDYDDRDRGSVNLFL